MARKEVVDAILVPKGYQQVTTLSAAQGITPASQARAALIQALTQDVRWRDDGTNPTSTVGMLLEAGRDMYYTGDLSQLRFIEVLAGAELNISYYG